MGKQAKPEEPAGESAPMWIVSFADLVTLMMSFFVVLYALKQGGAPQQAQTAAAIAHQFGAESDPNSDDLVNQYLQYYEGRNKLPVSKDRGNADWPAKGPDGKDPQVKTIREGNNITTGGTVQFDPGSVALDDQAKKTIKRIAELVRGYNNVLFVKGHAAPDELALHPEDSAGMQLALQRAYVVTEALVKEGINRKALRPVPCGAFEPVKNHVYDASGQKMNRRVEVYTTDTIVSDFEPNNTVKPAGAESGEAEEPQPREKKVGEKSEVHKTDGGNEKHEVNGGEKSKNNEIKSNKTHE